MRNLFQIHCYTICMFDILFLQHKIYKKYFESMYVSGNLPDIIIRI